MKEEIKIEYEAFVADGEESFGMVREISDDGVILDVENADDELFFVPFDAIEDVHSKKIIVDWDKLDSKLREAIKHAHDAELSQYR